jgi:hypothetical protein
MTDTAKPVDPPAPGAVPGKSSKLPLLIVSTACGIGSLILLASAAMSSKAATPEARAGSTDLVRVAARAATPPSTELPVSTSAPQWMVSGRVRSSFGPQAVAFELMANQDVDVWHKRVRPVLSVRCVAKTIEVFVVTGSAASVENQTSQHSVLVSFDAGEEIPQLWEHSIDHDALFAPDGNALAHQIAGAHLMSFTFTPFNTPPALVNFSVAGLDQRLAASGKVCGW